ncbi:unnamed protein product [Fusarium graminearum]|uniref:Chromosome 3, complete genome n=1 Tax=Gibberella zeae (strain ATCC MYA-4620 / CBS 123657 / FGSC 9075 / NRRL 31084 / PH-1) TaxID=229533 RepID=I1S784_GIBZE|nr:hypothetical protein FGSG_12707 [Fusarium graminearum PH-1]ESU11224.1 hypothetical protein FGSG_12707 [Fusarium graminearum PH-1]EYB30192.1 hypothetical protein FG05_12707 [Fusarium graminearum]CEF87950.1 unnamed protein product [Fusarium graminearum]CZS83878.1 unnamed protein product [Fusarium graminearum]|eukprot:XP_011323800.1 hypothetical protein FGSG_12707 [Fusarium graminearum PH-1]
MDLGHIIGEDRLVMLDCLSCTASSHLQPSNSYFTSTVSSYFALPSFLKDSSSHVPYKIHSCYCYACISLIHVAEHQHITSEPARTVSLLFYLFIKGTPETTNNSSSFRYCAP